MSEICPVCGLPKELCVCDEIKGEAARIKVKLVKAKFGKFMTVVEGIEKSQLKPTLKELKRKLACGGAIKEGKLYLQGDHKRRIKKFLVNLGYKEENIEME